MSEETWLSFPEAVQLVRDRIGASVGRAEALVREARQSGKVRPRDPALLLADDGVVDMALRPGRQPLLSQEQERFDSAADFSDWLDHHIAANKRQPASRAGTAASRAARAAQAIWGNAGPPAHLPDKVICNEIRDRVRDEDGTELTVIDKTIMRGVRAVGKA